jgi:hypothetical protein
MEALYQKLGQPVAMLSRLYVYFVSRVRIEGTPASEDSGCMIRDVMKALNTIGACAESTWPYDISKFSSTPSAAADAEASSHEVTTYQACPDLASVKQAIADGFPVVGGFSVPENMMSQQCAQTGIVQMPGPNEQIVGGHCVMFVGYDDSTSLIKFANSWGTGWGDSGHGYLPYGFFTDTGNGPLADDCWTITNEETPTPTPTPAPTPPTPPSPPTPTPPDPTPTPPTPPSPPSPIPPDPTDPKLAATRALMMLIETDGDHGAMVLWAALDAYAAQLQNAG